MKKVIIPIIICVLLSSVAINTYGQEDFKEMAEVEANYILQCQFLKEDDPAYGCINDIYGPPTWVVPRENAMAILGLIMASELLDDSSYLDKARLAADYLVRVQDKDGAWYNQYTYAQAGNGAGPENNESLAKSPTQTAEVMIAFYKLGFDPKRYTAMKKAAGYLMSCQKKGGNGFLLGGGKDAQGNFRDWRWASDNSYAYQALKAAEVWAIMSGDLRFAIFCGHSARKIIQGIDSKLYIKNPYDPDFGVWYRAVDGNDQPIDVMHHDWINYAPQMLDLPCRGVNSKKVGEWIHNNLQSPDGGCVWDDDLYKTRVSPGYSFQATLCWRDLGQSQYYYDALYWALNKSGLWQTRSDGNNVIGGWIDWLDNAAVDPGNRTANWWERFIDTSFYAIAAYNGGYDFGVLPGFLRISYSNPESASQGLPCYLQFKFDNLNQQ